MFAWIGNVRKFDRLGRSTEVIDLELLALLVVARGRTVGQRKWGSRPTWKGIGGHHRKAALNLFS